MIPTRQKLIGWHKVTEYDFYVDEPVVYIDGKVATTETYDHAVERLEREL